MSLENICGKIVELDFAIRRDDTRARLAQVHLAQHAATDTQIGRRAIASRRLNYKHRFREFHVLSLAVCKLHCSRVYIRCRAFDSSIPHRQANTSNVETS